MFLQKVSIGVRAGLMAGVVLGIGARLAMRVVAAMSDRVTEFGVGDTLGILFIGSIIGLISVLIFMAFRRYIHGNGVLKGLSFGMFVYLMLAL